MKDTVVFTRKVTRSGKNVTKIISIPSSVHPLVEYGKLYKVTLEPITNSDSKEKERGK